MTAPSSPSAPSRGPLAPAEPPSVARLARLVHLATVDVPVTRYVHVRIDHREEAFDLGFWDVPPLPTHPIEALVGFVAPTSWDVVGLVSSGRVRHLDRPDQEPDPERIISTVLFQRDGAAASVIAPPGAEPQVSDEAPIGLIPDVLHRTLGRPTAPPDQPTGAMVDATWLDRIAAGVLQQRNRRRSWRWLADRHPLRGGGPVPEPMELRTRTAAYSQERSWADLRLLAGIQELPASRSGPPGGTTAPAGTWFDDGSFSRWVLGQLPPVEAVLPDLLSVLPVGAGASMASALDSLDERPGAGT